MDTYLVSVLNGLAMGSLLFAIALGLSLVFGMMDVLNLAHGAVYLVGAYVAVGLVGDGAGLAAFVLAVLVAAVVGAVLGGVLAGLTRAIPHHLDQALLTLGVALVVAELLAVVCAAIEELAPQEATLLRRHYLEGERFDHVAEDLGLSKSWASRLHTRAISRLARRLRGAAG